MGEQLRQGNGLKLSVAPCGQYGEIRCKLAEHLAAGAAGPAVVLPLTGDGDGLKIPGMSFTDRLDQSGAFGADGGAIGGVFHVAAGKYGAVGTQQSGSHREMGVGDIGVLLIRMAVSTRSWCVIGGAPFCV